MRYVEEKIQWIYGLDDGEVVIESADLKDRNSNSKEEKEEVCYL